MHSYLKPNSAFNVSSKLLNNIYKQILSELTIPTSWVSSLAVIREMRGLDGWEMLVYQPMQWLWTSTWKASFLITHSPNGGCCPFLSWWSPSIRSIMGCSISSNCLGLVEVLWWYKHHSNSLFHYIDSVESRVPSEGIGKLASCYGDWIPPPPYQTLFHLLSVLCKILNNWQRDGQCNGRYW